MMGMASWIAATLRQYPEIAIFLTLALGYYFGKFTFKGIGLGSVTATLLAGVLIGQLGITISAPLKATVFLLFLDRKSTRLNSSHLGISYAVFCLKKKKTNKH